MRVLTLVFPQLSLELLALEQRVSALVFVSTAEASGDSISRAPETLPTTQSVRSARLVSKARDACGGAETRAETRRAELKGNMRLSEVSAKARALGIEPGMTIARARAVCAELEVQLVAEHIVKHALERLCESVMRFGATVGFSLAPVPTVWIDTTGCSHLFGGEIKLIARVAEQVGAHVHQLALGDSPRLGQMVAQHSPAGSATLVTEEHLRALPVTVLENAAFFTKLGAHTLGDLQRIPKASLAHRLKSKEENPQDVLSLIWGIDRKPFAPYVPKENPEESIELDDDLELAEPLLFLVKPMLERLLVRVMGRGLAVLGLELYLGANCTQITVPSPMTRIEDLWGVLKTGSSLRRGVLCVFERTI
jgi:hypothetical protein